jgi:3-methyl-2-oxobutanoate hydroxymethyltransferase
MMGLFPDFKPKFAKRYVDLGTAVRNAVETYCAEVRAGTFPSAEHSFR